MTYHNDPNLNRPRVGDHGRGWLLPVGIAALAIILGIFFFVPSNNTTTATNTSPTTTTRTTPAPTPTPVTPAPAPARPTGG